MTAGELLTLPELRALRAKSAWRGAGLVLHAWSVIAGAVLLYAAWPSPLTLLLAVVVIGGRQLGLAVLMHEAAHWLLLPGQPANTRVGTWLCAAPIWADLPAYRRRHHLHHRHTRRPEDPDLALSAAMTRGALGRALLGDLAGWTTLRRLAAWPPAPGWRRLGRPIAVNAVLLGGAALAGAWYVYPLLWLLPLATWYPLAGRIRDRAEHALVPDDGDALRNARTTGACLLERALLAPYWVNHHLEHHLLAFVPCWRLRDAHALLVAKGHGARMEVAPGYLDVVGRVAAGSAR